jgi:hypothetical protein
LGTTVKKRGSPLLPNTVQLTESDSGSSTGFRGWNCAPGWNEPRKTPDVSKRVTREATNHIVDRSRFQFGSR